MRDNHNRRVIVGLDSHGRSAVASDARDMTCIAPDGVSIQEIWWQSQIPARENENGNRIGEIGIAPPPTGAVVRLLSVPPFSKDSVWKSNLHCDDALHVITLTSGQLDIVLEIGEVALHAGDSIVLPGSMHDLRNMNEAPANFVYTSFPLVR